MNVEGLRESLLATFLEESREGISRAEGALLRMGSGGATDEIDDVFRAIHSLKGSAGSMALPALAQVAHAFESHLDVLRTERRAPERTLLSIMLRTLDGLRTLLDDVAHAREPAPTIVASLTAALTTWKPGSQPVGTSGDWLITFTPQADVITRGLEPLLLLRALDELGPAVIEADLSRLPTFQRFRHDVCLLAWKVRLPASVEKKAIEEVFEWLDGGWTIEVDGPAQARGAERAAPAAQAQATTTPTAENATIRIPIPRIDQLMNMVGELVITQAMLGELEEEDGPIDAVRAARLRAGLGLLARNTHALQDGVMRLRSVPLSAVFGRLPRLVHDVATQLGKDVHLDVSGEGTELDKTVIERLGDPVMHLVRNCLDHGLEGPADRRAAGKPATGTVKVTAWQRGGEVLVEVSDDGRGLNFAKIKARAIERGLLVAEAQPTDDELTRLIFEPGFSTAEAVTDISGRGVGMDVVLRNVKALGGDISVTSAPGQGSKFLLRLPVSLAIIDGLLVKVAGHTWVIPLLSIIETVQPEPSQLERLGPGHVVRLREQLIPTLSLCRLLGLSSSHESQLMVVVEGDGNPVGLLVDELLGQQQVVVKSLDANYGPIAGVQGATILGDGSVSFILEVSGLTRAASSHRRAA